MTQGVKIAVLAAITGGLAILSGGLGVSFFGKLSASQIAAYARQAGFNGMDLVIAVAIALAESSGDPGAPGDETVKGDPSTATSIGLWQIHFTVHPEYDPDLLKDPQYNANAAFALYTARGNSFRDWSTFTVPVAGVLPYTKFLNDAQQGVSA